MTQRTVETRSAGGVEPGEEPRHGNGEAQGVYVAVADGASEQASPNAAVGSTVGAPLRESGAAAGATAAEALRDGRLRSELASIVVVGATSSIGRAIADRFAELEPRARFVLAARRGEELERIAADLRVRRGVDAVAAALDVTDGEQVDALAEALASSPGRLRGLVLAQGFMTEQAEAERDADAAVRMIEVNYTGAVRLMTKLLPTIKDGGFVAGVSSVAGSNFAYGSTKAALTTYLHGLRGKLTSEKRDVSVTIVKPGFTDTAMTYGGEGMFLVAPPEAVAGDAVRAIRKKRAVAYTPWFWRWIMAAICAIPRAVFDRLGL